MGNQESASVISSPLMNGETMEETVEDKLERIEKDNQTLSDRCATLEAQNILVAVQQLDIMARAIAIASSSISVYYYWKLLWGIMAHIPLLLEQYPSAQVASIQILLHPIPWTILKFLLTCGPFAYNYLTFGSAHRRFEVFAVAFIVIVRMKLCRWREHMFVTEERGDVAKFGEDMSENAIWNANYDISARFLYVSILRLKGLWTKSAQYLSSRADFMPECYVRELKKLQDDAPATSWEDVKKMLSPQLLSELVDINHEPLASASIGQVHTARLKSTGEKVVVKVQHPHARTLMTDDFWSLKVIARIVAWMDPEYEFFEILMREWATEARKELNFITEAENLKSAKKAIDMFTPEGKVVYTKCEKSAGIPFQVEIPIPVSHLCDANVLIMSFCEGTRVDNFTQLEDWGLSRDAVMDAVAQSFAHMMYISDIFNGDPHPGTYEFRFFGSGSHIQSQGASIVRFSFWFNNLGAILRMMHCTLISYPITYTGNIFIRCGTSLSKTEGFTVVLLDWGLAKSLPDQKRIAFCQMAYAAATFDYGLLLDAFNTIGLKMKRENVAEDLESMRFFLRDMAPREKSRKRIKNYIKADKARIKSRKKGEKVPMDSKAYPGEFFFFVRVNELLHGLGSRFGVEMSYLDLLKPYAERGLRLSDHYSVNKAIPMSPPIKDHLLQEKLDTIIEELQKEKLIAGVQICVIDKDGSTLANVVGGTLGGLKKHIPMRQDALILGYSCTKSIAATMAHIMVEEGYITYDEPVCKQAWPSFCATEFPPTKLEQALLIDRDELRERWAWKRQVTLQDILTHKSGLWAALPAKMTIKSMVSCEQSFAAFEYNENSPDETLLPTRKPGEKAEYHFMSFGWLVAGTLCGAYSQKHDKVNVTFEEVYEAVLLPKLSHETIKYGFRPCGGSGDFPLAHTVTTDINASQILQRRREAETLGEMKTHSALEDSVYKELFESFKGKEFLLDSRVWNCDLASNANVPAAGGRFSAMGLAHFYHDLGSGKVLKRETLEMASSVAATENVVNMLQGATTIANDSDNDRTILGYGYQLIRFDKDKAGSPSGFGHAGIGGSIGYHHRPSGLSVGLMLNKSDGGKEITTRIMRVVANHFNI